MNLAHKIRIKPNKKQQILLNKSVGVARFSYNWALSKCRENYKNGKKTNILELKKEFNSIKHKEYPWIKECPKDANQQPFANLKKAFNNYFKKLSKKPVLKKKGKHDSFYLSNDKVKIKDNYIVLSKIGKIKLTENPRFDGKLLSVNVSKQAGYWFVSLNYELNNYTKKRKSNNIVGLDLGIDTTIMCSDKKEYNSPKPLKAKLKQLKTLSKSHSRKVKGSNNKRKLTIKLSKLHYKITNIRKDFIHKATSNICNENQVIVIEDLNVKGMLANHKLARSLSDVSFGEIRRQLVYKSDIYNNHIIIADRFYPSSKTCSNCGNINQELTLKDRMFECKNCGVIINRDYNASLNLRTLGYRGSQACGHESSGYSLLNSETIMDEAGISECSLLNT